MAFSISSAPRVLEVLCCHILIEFLSNRSLHVMVDSCLSKLVNVVLGAQHGSDLDPSLFLLKAFVWSFFPFWKISRPVMLMTPLWWLLCHPQVYIIGLELQSPRSVTLAGLVNGVTFMSHHRSLLKNRSLLGRCFQCFVLPVLETCSVVSSSAADTHLNLLDRESVEPGFRVNWGVLTEGVFECDITHRRSMAVLFMQRSAVIRCTLLIVLYLDRMCQCGLHALL